MVVNCMLDLESWGVTPGCAVRSIGAVTFALEDDHQEQFFYANIDTHSCLYARLHIEQGTHEWWQRQGEEARAALKVNPRPLIEVVRDFNKWFTGLGSVRETALWAQGANFDPGVWEAATYAAGLGVPWMYYCVRDTRTLYALADFDPREVTRTGVYHSALDDARHQVVCCRAAWAKLQKRNNIS